MKKLILTLLFSIFASAAYAAPHFYVDDTFADPTGNCHGGSLNGQPTSNAVAAINSHGFYFNSPQEAVAYKVGLCYDSGEVVSTTPAAPGTSAWIAHYHYNDSGPHQISGLILANTGDITGCVTDDYSYLGDGVSCPPPGVDCPDGSTADTFEECPVDPVCPGKRGQQTIIPGFHRLGTTNQQRTDGAGTLLGCEYSIMKCDDVSCIACFTGNGRFDEESENKDSYKFRAECNGSSPPSSCGQTYTVDEACPENDTPTQPPIQDGICSRTDDDYNAITNSCDGVPVTKNCDDPSLTDDEPCNLTEVISGVPTYEPPVKLPQLNPTQFQAPPVTPLPPPPPVNTGLNPGYTGGGIPSSGTVGNNAGGVPTTNVNPGFSGGSGTASTADTGSVGWGNLPTISEDGFYTRQYEGGVAAVFADRMTEIQATPLMQFTTGFNIPDGVGVSPIFSIDMSGLGMGVFEFGFFQADYVFTVLKILVIFSAFIFARKIIFGG
jgi:hypothetical protein